MAPEQAGRDRAAVGPAADVYALGAILYELLTGRPPFRGATVLETLDQVRSREPVPPRQLGTRVPCDLETICLKCLQKEPAQRYGSAEALANDLRRYQAGEPITARPVGPVERGVRWCRRRPVIAALTAALAAAVLAGFSTALYLWRRAADGEKAAVGLLHQAEAARQDAEDSNQATLQVLADLVEIGRVPQTPQSLRQMSVKMLREAEAKYQTLLDKPGHGRAAETGLAEVYLIRANLHLQSGQRGEAQTVLENALRLWGQLAQRDPASPAWREGLARTQELLGDLYAGLGCPVQSLQWFRQAYPLRQALTQEQPTPSARLNEATCAYRLAGLLMNTGRHGEALPLLEASRDLLGRLVQEGPEVHRCHWQLVQVDRARGDCHAQHGDPDQAAHCWRQACAGYRQLLRQVPDHTPVELELAACCRRLGRLFPSDPVCQEAVALGERALRGAAKRVEEDPMNPANRQMLAQVYWELAECHLQAGDAARAAETYRQNVRVWEELAARHPDNPKLVADHLQGLFRLIDLHNRLGQIEAAHLTAAEAVAVIDRHTNPLPADIDSRYLLGTWINHLGYQVRRAGLPAEALRLAERCRLLFEGLVMEEPDQIRHALGLIEACNQAAKAHADMRRDEDEVAAWLRSIEVQRRAVARWPSEEEFRHRLGMRYVRLGRKLAEMDRRAEAAAWFLAQENLYPDDAAKLAEIADELTRLAGQVGAGPAPLSAAERAEQQRYLDQSARLTQRARVLGKR